MNVRYVYKRNTIADAEKSIDSTAASNNGKKKHYKKKH